MLAILNSLNAHNLPIFQPSLMILVSKFMAHTALSDKTYLSLGLLSPLIMPKEAAECWKITHELVILKEISTLNFKSFNNSYNVQCKSISCRCIFLCLLFPMTIYLR